MNRKNLYKSLALVCLLTALGLAGQTQAKARKALEGVVNVNMASIAELTMLPGIGPKRAQAIQEYAQAHPFATVEELKNIKGIGDKSLEKLRPFVTVTGETTAQWASVEPSQS